MENKSPSWTTRVVGITLVLAVNVLLILAAEFTVRALRPFPPTTAQTYQSDAETLYSHTPNSSGWEISPVGEYEPVKLIYNGGGFRGPPLNQKKPPGEVRVFALGDSIVEGRQVAESDTVSKQLETLLRQGGLNANVINAGVSAYTTTTMNLMLRNRVAKLDPDVVVAFMFANDYTDNFVYGNYSAHPIVLSGSVPPELVPKGLGLAKATTVNEWLRQHSAIFDALASVKAVEVPSTPDTTLSAPRDFVRTARAVNKPDLSPEEQRLVDFTHAGLQAMADFCKDRKIAFLVAIVPWPPQVSKEEWKTGKWRFGYGPDETDMGEIYQKRILDYAKANNIAAIDLLPTFRTRSTEAPLSRMFFSYDGHLTSAGHEVAARGVLPHVLQSAIK